MRSATTRTLSLGLFLGTTALFAVAFSWHPAQAQNLMVTARIGEACIAVGGTLNFGTYDPLAAGPLLGSGSISLTCTSEEEVLVALGPGQAAPDTTRKMQRAGGGALAYQLFQDVGGLIQWGDGTLYGDPKPHEAALDENVIDVFGSIPGGQPSPAGDYSDTVLITISSAP